MIGFLTGEVVSTDNSSLILLCGEVGYKVSAPLPLLVSVQEGEFLSLHIHTHVREDHIALYGFKDSNELQLFEKLISISGIGPKSALAMLSVHSPSSIADAVERGDAPALSHTPGIGKKTAEKIILELKGKLSHLVRTEENDATLEARLALEALGYSAKEIHDALKDVKAEGKSTGVLIKEAISQLQ